MIAELASKFMPQAKTLAATPEMLQLYRDKLGGEIAEAEDRLKQLQADIAESDLKLSGLKKVTTDAQRHMDRLTTLIEKSKAQRAMIQADLPSEVATMQKAVVAGVVVSNILADPDSQWTAPFLISRGWVKRGEGWVASQRDYSLAGVLTAQQAVRQQAALDLAAFRNSTADEFESVCGFRPPI